MILPEKRGTPTASSALPSQTFLDSSSVALAISKLNDTIKNLRSTVSSQNSLIGALAAFMTIFLVCCLSTAALCLVRYLNRVRASRGQDMIPYTSWAMFQLGPAPQPSNSREMTMAPEKLVNPYLHLTESTATFNGEPDKLHRSGTSHSGSTDTLQPTIPPAIDHSVPLGIFPNQHDQMSTQSLPNANRYTIDIEYDSSKMQAMEEQLARDPYRNSNPYSEVSHLHVPKASGKQTAKKEVDGEEDFDYESYYQSLLRDETLDPSYTSEPAPSHIQGIQGHQEQNKETIQDQERSKQTNTPGIATTRHFTDVQKPRNVNDEEYDDFNLPPMKKFVAVSGHDSYNGRQLMASSVYPNTINNNINFNHGFEEVPR